jgi:hypothetical protein
VKNIFNWFKNDDKKKKKKGANDSHDEGDHSDEIDSNEEDIGTRSSHRSADIEE